MAGSENGSHGSAGLRDDQLSALYLDADAVSGRGQRRTRTLVRVELLSLVVAGSAGVTTWRVGVLQFDLLAIVSVVFFVAALASTLVRSMLKPEQGWYEGRAAAESARTLCWRYAVGGNPFPVGEPADESGSRFLQRLRDVVTHLEGTTFVSADVDRREITPAMGEVRARDLDMRKLIYKRDRLSDQLGWYHKRARSHDRAARQWISVVIAASALGVVAAGFKAFAVDIDLLGVCAAVASAGIAWNQLNQNRNQATAYAVTARELSIIRDQVDLVPLDEWPAFVSDAEDAISREHTLWLARHGNLPPAAQERST